MREEYRTTFWPIGRNWMIMAGPTADRPASSAIREGRVYIEDDGLHRMWRDNGSAWEQFGCPLSTALVTKTASYTATDADGIIVVDATVGNVVITLPSAIGSLGKGYTVKRTDGSANTVTVQGAETIDDAASQLLNQYDSLVVVSDNAEWWIR